MIKDPKLHLNSQLNLSSLSRWTMTIITFVLFLKKFHIFHQSQQCVSSLYFNYYLFVQAPFRTPLSDYSLSVSIVMLKWIMVVNGTKEKRKQVRHSSPTLPLSSKYSLQPHQPHTPPPLAELNCWTFSKRTVCGSWEVGWGGVGSSRRMWVCLLQQPSVPSFVCCVALMYLLFLFVLSGHIEN